MDKRSRGPGLSVLIRRILFILTATGLLVAVAVTPAAATATRGTSSDDATPVASTSVVAAAQMTFDCAAMTGKALQYAEAHGYCTRAGGVQPYTTVAGNCGDSFLYMWNAGGGDATFWYGFHSTDGTVYYRDLVVSWYNWSRGGGSNFTDATYMWNSSYSHYSTRYTKAGFVSGVMSGHVILWWGGICSISYPTSSTTVYW